MKHRSLLSIVLVVVLFGAGCAGESKDDYAAKMAEQHAHDTTVATPITAEPTAAVDTSSIPYGTIDGQVVTGYMAAPANVDSARQVLGLEAGSALPGVIVIQEWWGLNDNIKAMARRLAGEGYRALAVDLYGGQVATQSEQAQQLVQRALQNQPALIENLRAAYRYLAEEQNAPRVGVVGWCFGGAMSLQAALALPKELDATVIYYGRLVEDRAALTKLEMPILGFFGGQDDGIPLEQVRAFEQTLKDLGKEVEIHVYENAGHAFANPTGNNYDAGAAEDSWARTLAFFKENLTGEVFM